MKNIKSTLMIQNSIHILYVWIINIINFNRSSVQFIQKEKRDAMTLRVSNPAHVSVTCQVSPKLGELGLE